MAHFRVLAITASHGSVPSAGQPITAKESSDGKK
jgi:hypothetical protein